LCLALVPLAQIGQGLAPTVVVYAVAAFAIGATLGVLNALVFALLLREIREHDRGKVLALVNGLSRTATIGALTIGGVVGAQCGARTAYVVCGCAGLVIAATAALRVRARIHRTVDAQSIRRSVCEQGRGGTIEV
jgi:predicted MFS family arabinose efflux permease